MTKNLEHVFNGGGEIATNGEPLVFYFLSDRHFPLPPKEEMFRHPQFPNASVVVVDTLNGTTVHFAPKMPQSCVEVLREVYPEVEGDACTCRFPQRIQNWRDLSRHLRKRLTLPDSEKIRYLRNLSAEEYQRVAYWAIPFLLTACDTHFTSGVRTMQKRMEERMEEDGGLEDMDEYSLLSMANEVLGIEDTLDEEDYEEE